jgi:hypothetical protein
MDKQIPYHLTRENCIGGLCYKKMNQNKPEPQIQSYSYMNKYGTVRYRNGAAYSVGCGIGVAQTRVQRSSGRMRRSSGRMRRS